MTYFKDLTSCVYHNGPYDQSNWNCPFLAVGWLEKDNEFSKGDVDKEIIEKIKVLTAEFESSFPRITFRGLHDCSLCSNGEYLDSSHVNLFIPGKEKVFIAPGRIDHYIEVHSYLPPVEFIDAVRECPSPNSTEYRERLKKLNKDVEAPIYK